MIEEINVTEAAKRLGVTVGWIRRLCIQGRIEGARKIGRDWVIPAGAKIEVRQGPRLRAATIPRKPRKPRKPGEPKKGS